MVNSQKLSDVEENIIKKVHMKNMSYPEKAIHKEEIRM
jgi:hypothetical protein